jgi:uncharacterized MAPEG superfamily protein
MRWSTESDDMTVTYLSLLVACLLPIVCAGIAKSGTFGVRRAEGGYDNHDPRAWLARQTGRRARANAAQANSFEALPLFIAGLMVAWHRQADPYWVNILAGAFVLCRVAYIAMYVTDRATARSLWWMAGVACCLALFFLPKP